MLWVCVYQTDKWTDSHSGGTRTSAKTSALHSPRPLPEICCVSTCPPPAITCYACARLRPVPRVMSDTLDRRHLQAVTSQNYPQNGVTLLRDQFLFYWFTCFRTHLSANADGLRHIHSRLSRPWTRTHLKAIRPETQCLRDEAHPIVRQAGRRQPIGGG